MKKFLKKLFKLFLILISILLLVFIVYSLIINSYTRWEQSKLTAIENSNYLYNDKEYPEIEVSLQNKIEEYSVSTEKIETIELTNQEAIYELNKILELNIPTWLKIEKIAYKPNDGNWLVFLFLKLQFNNTNIKLPLVEFNVFKDNIETPELYVKSIKVWDIDIDRMGAEKIRQDINEGIRQAIVLVNENNFSGREYINIELEEEAIIIKGEKQETF